MPGLIDAHVHLPQLRIRGTAGGQLLTWLRETTFPEEMRFADPAYARDVAQEFFRALAESGTTAAAVYLTSHRDAAEICVEEAGRSGLRILLGDVLMDREAPDGLLKPLPAAIDDARAIARLSDSCTLVDYIVTPRFPVSCTAGLMRAAGELANEMQARVQSHYAENQDEIALVGRLFPEALGYADVFARSGLLSERTLLAHSVHPTDHGLEALAERGAWIVHCPESNRRLGSGRFPLERVLKAGVPFCLGSDVGAGGSLDMRDAMREMMEAQAPGRVTPSRAFHHATAAGAAALGLPASGRLADGDAADLVVLNVCEGAPRVDSAEASEMLDHIIHCRNCAIAETWVAGGRVDRN